MRIRCHAPALAGAARRTRGRLTVALPRRKKLTHSFGSRVRGGRETGTGVVVELLGVKPAELPRSVRAWTRSSREFATSRASRRQSQLTVFGALGREAKGQGNWPVLRARGPRRDEDNSLASVAGVFGASSYHAAMSLAFADSPGISTSFAPARARPNPSTRTSTAVKRLLCISSW